MSDNVPAKIKADLDAYDALDYRTHPAEKEAAWDVIVLACHSWLHYLLSEIARLNTDVRVQGAEIEELEGDTSALRRGVEAAWREGFYEANAMLRIGEPFAKPIVDEAWKASSARKQLEAQP